MVAPNALNKIVKRKNKVNAPSPKGVGAFFHHDCNFFKVKIIEKLKMIRDDFLMLEEGCNKYLDNCRAENLREGTIILN